MDIRTRRGFLNLASAFEGMTLLLGLAIGWATGALTPQSMLLRGADLLWGLAAVGPMLISFVIAGDLRQTVSDLLGRSLATCRWYDLLALAVLAGLGEEVLFRGALQPWLSQWHPLGGVIVVNLLFGLAHALSIKCFLFAFIVGMYFSWLYTGIPSVHPGFDNDNLLRPVVAHAVYDYIAFLVVVRDYRPLNAE